MPVAMEDVRAVLDPEEPDYEEAAQLGPEALPHLEVLVSSGDTMLASKATYLASLIKDGKSAEIVRTAAQSDDPAVRVAAAAAASNLSPTRASAVLSELVGDADAGVRKVARASLPERPTGELARKLEELPEEPEASAGAADLGATGTPLGPMPGERPAGEAGTVDTMPGEQRGGMPGEQRTTMPGERGGMPGG